MSSAPPAKKAKTEAKAEVQTGTVTTFQSKRGFGFISQEVGPDVFVHQSIIHSADDGYRCLRVGQVVEFTAVCENERWKATRVTGIDGAALPTQPGTSTAAKAAKANRKRGRHSEPATQLTGDALNAAVKKQIGYYLSDANLKRDLWMRKLLLDSNAVSVRNLLKCNKLKALTTDLTIIETAVNGSDIIHMTTLPDEENEGSTQPAVARGPDADNVPALPEYVPPTVLLLTDLADTGVTWKDIRAGYLAAYKAPVFTYLTSDTPFIIVNSIHHASVAQAVEGGIKNVEGKQICTVQEVSDAEQREALLKSHYDALGKQATRKTRKRGRNERRQAEEGPVSVGSEEFKSSQDVYDKVRGIMRSYKNDEPILGEDKKFVMSLLKAHPRAAEKLKYVRKVIVKENHQHDGNSRCFFVVNKDGAEEDISYVKCIRNLQQ